MERDFDFLGCFAGAGSVAQPLVAQPLGGDHDPV